MSNLKQDWFDELNKIAVNSVAVAMRKANDYEQGIWELPNGKFIALQRGLLVPRGSVRVASRVTPGGRWQLISEARYEECKYQASVDEMYF